MHFLFKRRSFLPGDSRVLPTFGETRVKYTTRRAADYLSLFILFWASIWDEGTAVVFPYLAPSCCIDSQRDPRVWLRLPWGPRLWRDSYLFLNLVVAECGCLIGVYWLRVEGLFPRSKSRQKWSLDPMKGAGWASYLQAPGGGWVQWACDCWIHWVSPLTRHRLLAALPLAPPLTDTALPAVEGSHRHRRHM